MFIKLVIHSDTDKPIVYIIKISDITYIKEYIDCGYKRVEIYIKGHGAIKFNEADDTKPLLDYMKSNNLMIDTNT